MKKVLIITYYWPPSGGSGVQRWLKMSKYFPQNGWQPIIYTADNAEYPVEDTSLEDDIAPEAIILKRAIIEPYTFYKKFLGIKKNEKIKAGFINEGEKKKKWKENISIWIRGNFFIPDARCWWIKPSIKYLSKYLKNNLVDAIISTGPPHSMHMIARALHEKLNIPWVADFRDPWTDIDFYKDLHLTKCADKKNHRFEKEVLRSANEVVTVGKHCAARLKQIGNRDIKIITNGYDFNIDDLKKETKLTERFTLSHMGIIGENRNPEKFWEAIKELIDQESERINQELKYNEQNTFPKMVSFKDALNIRLIGQVDRKVVESVEVNGLKNYVDFIPYIPHNEVIKKQAESQVLLLFINKTPNAKSIMTGKIFEYMTSGRPILAVGPEDGDIAAILKETQTGIIIDFDDKKRMKDEIWNLFSKYRQNKLVTRHNEVVYKYSRKNLASNYVNLLNSL